MRQRSTLIFLALALCSSLPGVHAGEPPKLGLSTQQTREIIAALAAATNDEASLAALPEVASRYLLHLTGTTGVHCIDRNHDESYYGMTVMVGDQANEQQRHVVFFTLAPHMGSEPNTLGLAALLRGRTVTQYSVMPVGPVKRGNSTLFTYHARDPKHYCAVPPAKMQY